MTARRANRVDGNQDEIVNALRAIGCSVQSLAAIGDGCPDLLVGVERANILIEVKDPAQQPCKRHFNALQKQWHSNWRGTAHLVETVDQAVAVVEFYRRGRAAA